MLSIPSFLFYAATVALVVVCAFIAVLLFYFIALLRAARTVLARIDADARSIRARLEAARGYFAIVEDFLGRRARYEP